MQTFLEKTVKYILEKHNKECLNVVIITPGRRSGLYIKKYIAENITTPIWSPNILSIEDFIIKLTGYNIADNNALVFELYEVYRDLLKDEAKDFSEFLSWAQMLLSDFNDVDLALANPRDVFNYLSDEKNIDLWSPEGKELSENQERYLVFFQSLYNIYNAFTEKLKETKNVYKGLLYRYAAENIEELSKKWLNSFFYFVGFNALNPSETHIFKNLNKYHKCKFLWDVDEYYLNNPINEAGRLISKNIKIFDNKNEPKWIEKNFQNNKTIHITGFAGQIAQTKYLGDLIQKEKAIFEASDKTAIVLCDESLLFPVLFSIPSDAGEYNVTMGYPLNRSFVFNLFDDIMKLFNENRSFSSEITQETDGDIIICKYYFKNIINIFNNELIKQSFGKEIIEKILKNIYNLNKYFIDKNDLLILTGENERINNFIIQLFNKNTTPTEILISLENLLNLLMLCIKEKEDSFSTIDTLNYQLLYNFLSEIKILKELLTIHNVTVGIKELYKLIKKTVFGANTPFAGEPLKGFQVMGMLETRNLDFENIILLSVNEGTLPSSNNKSSFISLSIRKKFGLETRFDSDDIYAYHFYRLLQRAKNIWLFYNTLSDDLSLAEKSRLIHQLIFELPKYNKEIVIKESIASYSKPADISENDIIIEANEFINKKLLNFAKTGISPTMLNVYRNCSLNFYYTYIANINDQEEPTEYIDEAGVGTLVHNTLYYLYLPYSNIKLNTEILDKIKNNIEKSIEIVIKEEMPQVDFQSGKNILLKRIAVKYIHKFVQYELNLLKNETPEIIIQHLEEKHIADIIIGDPNNELTIKLSGKIDRIDIYNKEIRLIDYKTGNAKLKDINIQDWQAESESKDNNIAIQLYFYSYLLYKNGYKQTSPGVYSLKNMKDGFIEFKDKNNINSVSEKIIKDILEKIFFENNTYSKTTEVANCLYCNNKIICHK